MNHMQSRHLRIIEGLKCWIKKGPRTSAIRFLSENTLGYRISLNKRPPLNKHPSPWEKFFEGP